MDTVHKLIFDNFAIFFAFCALWTIGGFAWMLWRRKKRNLFPDEAKDVVYEERTASGRSHKNWYSKLGGAQNCLRLVITKTELWITPIFPFSALAGTFDLDHRIPLEKISSIDANKIMFKKSLLITYRDPKDEKRVVEVIPKDAEGFEMAPWIQLASAIDRLIPNINSLGVLKSKHFLGRLLSFSIISWISSCVISSKLDPFVAY